MAVQFHELPLEIFPEESRPYIARLNRELRDLFGLEGVIRNPVSTRRSDNTIVRRSTVQVDVSRITPSLTQVISGSSTVVGTPNLTFGTVNTVGSTTTAISTNSTLALFGTQAPVGYATAGAVGSSAFAARADFILPFPEALGALSDRTDQIVLTDDGTYGALLTSSNTFAANFISLQAPGASNPIRFGKYGNISVGGGGTAADTTLFLAQKSDFNEATATPSAANFTITNTNVGASPIACRGFFASVTASMADAGSTSTNRAEACAATVIGGAAGNNFWNGTARAFSGAALMNIQTAGTSVSNPVELFVASGHASSTITRMALNDWFDFRAKTVTLVSSGTLNNFYGFACDAITSGITRTSFHSVGATTGTPTLVIAFRSLLHGVGTTRRSAHFANTEEITTGHLLFSGTSQGCIFKDTQGTAEYWKMHVDSTGTKDATLSVDENGIVTGTRGTSATGTVTVNIIDTGTSAPAA